MEKHINQIELINYYINGQLSENERQNFEDQLQSNPEFNVLYQEQLNFLEGLKRLQLKAEITSAKSSYITTKWLKIIGLPILIIGLGILCYVLFFDKTNTENQPEINQVQKTIVVIDSVDTKMQSEKTIDIIKPKNKKEGILKMSEIKTVSNSKTEEKIVITDSLMTSESLNSGLIDFYESNYKEPQVFKINTKKDTVIICKEGTKIHLKKNSFVLDENIKRSNGEIDLYVTEFYELSDMLLANLSTKSDESIIETGGMINFYGLIEEEVVRFNEKKEATIEFPNRRNKSGMQLFLGEEKNNNINWKLQNNNKVLVTQEPTAILVSEADVQVPINLVEEPPVFPGCENGTKEEKVKCFSDAVDEVVKKNFNNDFAEELNLNGKYRITVSFVINKEGKIDEIVARGSHTKLAEEAVRVVELLPQMTPAKQRGFNVIVPYSFPITFQIGESTKMNNNSLISFKGETQFEKQIKARLVSKDSVAKSEITQEEYSRYAFTTSNLGWINCDRFVRAKNKTKFKLKIKDAKGADVKLVFKSISSILPSKKRGVYTDFGDVPTNEEVVLIAIKKVEDKLFLGIKETTTKPIDELDLDFNEVSVDQLKAKLQALNKGFN